MIGYLEMNFPVLLAVLWLGYRAAGDPFDVQTIATMVSKMFVETGFVHEIFPLQLVGKIKFLTFTESKDNDTSQKVLYDMTVGKIKQIMLVDKVVAEPEPNVENHMKITIAFKILPQLNITYKYSVHGDGGYGNILIKDTEVFVHLKLDKTKMLLVQSDRSVWIRFWQPLENLNTDKFSRNLDKYETLVFNYVQKKGDGFFKARDVISKARKAISRVGDELMALVSYNLKFVTDYVIDYLNAFLTK